MNNNRQIGDNTFVTLEVELYDSSLPSFRHSQGAAFLGVALNDCSDGETCYICTQGITTIKIGNSVSSINCGSFGMLIFSDETGYIIGLEEGDSIKSENPVAGYFIEDSTNLVKDDLVLFYVQGNYEFQ